MIDLALTDDQAELNAAFVAHAERLFPGEELSLAARANTTVDISDDRWHSFASTGLLGVGAGQAVGGLGRGVAEEVLLQVALGSVAASGPIASTVVSAHVAQEAGALELAADLVAGRVRAVHLVAGLAPYAREGDLALTVDDNGAELVRVLATEHVDGIDVTTPIGRVLRTSDAVAALGGPAPLLRLRALVAGYLVGVADAAVVSSVQYATSRQQFGRPIGSFQAVKHRCAEMAVRAYGAKAQLLVAAAMLDTGTRDAGRLETNAAYLLASKAAKANADDNVQNHGAVGMTAEHPAGMFVRRAQVYARLAGTDHDLVACLLEGPRTVLGENSDTHIARVLDHNKQNA